MERPAFIGNYRDFIEADDSHYADSDELLSIGSPVGKKLGLQKIGIHIETLLPGRRTSWPHAESGEEEFVFVISGTPHAWVDGNIFPLAAGDFVAFPSGTGIAHTFLNDSLEPVLLLVGGEADVAGAKIIYPLHPARNEVVRKRGNLWEDAPTRVLGPHDGLPDALRQ